MISGKRGEEMGTLSKLLIGVLVFSTVAMLSHSYIVEVGRQYGVQVNDSEYERFFSGVNETLAVTQNVTADLEGSVGQSEDTSVVDVLLTGGYSAVKQFMAIPDIYFGLVTPSLEALGLSEGQASVVSVLLVGIIIIMVVGAVIALILKVRP